jgi:hypothetical protein
MTTTHDTTDWIERHTTPKQRHAAFLAGIDYAKRGKRPKGSYWQLSNIRKQYGFKHDEKHIRTTTRPEDNAKTDKATALEFGVTLQSAETELCDGRLFESCEHRGACTGLCVLKTGNGAYPATQRARDAKLHMIVDETYAFILTYAYELQVAINKQRRSSTPRPIINRPNINSDLRWHEILPALAHHGWGGAVMSLGYTKDPAIFGVPGGWHGPHFRESYSISEKSNLADVRRFILDGGNATIVHRGGTGAPVPEAAIRTYLGLPDWVPVHDTDKSDETILIPGAGVNALTAKGKARTTRSKFVVDLNGRLQSTPVSVRIPNAVYRKQKEGAS